MPRYYFDISVGPITVRDDVGQEFGTDYAAVCEAALLADEFKYPPPEHDADWSEGQVVVRNGTGREVARTSFFRDDESRPRIRSQRRSG
jgi:hypothetical protein